MVWRAKSLSGIPCFPNKQNQPKSKKFKKTNKKPRIKSASRALPRLIAPVAFGNRTYTGGPTMRPLTGGVRIVHREYFQDLLKVNTFSLVRSNPINPGISSMFPWLSVLAPCFEMYKFNKLKISYETDVSTSTDGSIILAVDFDAADSAPQSKQDMLAYEGCVRGPAWANTVLEVPAKNLALKRYMRFGTLPQNLDIKTYDVGTLWEVAMVAGSSGPAGELFVEYDVEFYIPSGANVAPQASQGEWTSSTTGSAMKPFGTGGLPSGLVETAGQAMFAPVQDTVMHAFTGGARLLNISMNSSDTFNNALDSIGVSAFYGTPEITAMAPTTFSQDLLTMTRSYLVKAGYGDELQILGSTTVANDLTSTVVQTVANYKNLLLGVVPPA